MTCGDDKWTDKEILFSFGMTNGLTIIWNLNFPFYSPMQGMKIPRSKTSCKQQIYRKISTYLYQDKQCKNGRS